MSIPAALDALVRQRARDRCEYCGMCQLLQGATFHAFYHPRTDKWALHFRWQGTVLAGLTPAGRATIAALDLNHLRRQRVRQAETLFELFPPPTRE